MEPFASLCGCVVPSVLPSHVLGLELATPATPTGLEHGKTELQEFVFPLGPLVNMYHLVLRTIATATTAMMNGERRIMSMGRIMFSPLSASACDTATTHPRRDA